MFVNMNFACGKFSFWVSVPNVHVILRKPSIISTVYLCIYYVMYMYADKQLQANMTYMYM